MDTDDKIAVIDDKNNIITYNQLQENSKEFAKHLFHRSIIAIMATNTLGSLLGYIASLQNKIVPLMLRNDLDLEQLQDYIKNYQVNFLWIPKYIEVVPEWKKNIIYEAHGYLLYQMSMQKVLLHQELALLLTTSGSTGGKKLVRISYKNLSSNTSVIAKYLNITSQERAITSLPMNYTYGLSVIHTHLYQKATLLLTEKSPYTKGFWEFFMENSGTSFAGVPYIYEMLKKMNFQKMNLPTLKTMTVAGGKIGAEEEQYFMEYASREHKQFIVMYGQTEATARISYRATEIMDKPQSIGKVIPEGRMWIEDKDGKRIENTSSRDEISEGKILEGEIVYQGENVAMGYAFTREDLSKGYEWGNILHTGDVGYQDKDGYFYIKGRKDRTIKLNGLRIDLKDLEEILSQKYIGCRIQCEVEKCMDKQAFKRIVIYLKTDFRERGEAEDMIGFVAKKLGLNQRYFRIERV